jgi:hypothetical protein
VYSALCCRRVAELFSRLSQAENRNLQLKVNMDAHLVGIDLAQLLLKQNAQREKQAPAKVKSDAESATAAKETRHRISLSTLREGKTP